MYVLKDRKCRKCGENIAVLSYAQKNKLGKYELIVDYGECIYCGKVEILPNEDYRSFVREFCEKKEG